MAFFRKYLVVVLALVIIAGCKQKKKPSLAGEDPVEVSDFIEFFEPLKLPYIAADSILSKKEKDSLLIGYKVFTQFVPDSILAKVYAKGVKPKIYVLGKVTVPKAETYLFVKTVTNDKKAVFVLGFDKDQKFIAGMPVLRPTLRVASSHLTCLSLIGVHVKGRRLACEPAEAFVKVRRLIRFWRLLPEIQMHSHV